MHNAFSLSQTAERVRVEETYRFNPRNGEWVMTSTPTRFFGAFHGTAPRWTGRTWTFTGAESFRLGDDPAVQIPMRVVYTWRSPTSFERAHIVYDGDSWTQRSGERCTKTPR
jgi:hypothetical protein